jgi:hypothetical protein
MTETTKLHTFRVLHGFKGLDASATKFKEDQAEDKVMFAYLNLNQNLDLDITKIAGIVQEVWTDAEGLLVAVQITSTPSGMELEGILSDSSKALTMGPIAMVRKDGSDDVLDSLIGIYFSDK